MSNLWWGVVLKVAVTLWLIAISVWDRLERRVPNALVLPVMFGALGWQGYVAAVRATNGLVFALIAWLVLFMMWRAHIFGGGDTKLLMALFALFPTVSFLILFSLVVLVVSIPLLMTKYAGLGLLSMLTGARQRVRDKQVLPTAEELHTQGQPYCWTLALPGVIYVWWML